MCIYQRLENNMELRKYKLGEIATIYNGSTPSTKESDNYDGDIIWATPKDLSDQQSKYFYCGSRNITEKGFDSCSTQMIPANNILMSSRAPIGLFAINKVDCCTNQGFKNIVLDKRIADVDFMYYFLKYHVKEIEALGSGTTFKEVSKASFEKYEISLPPLESQQKIAAALSALDDKILLNRRINAKLEQMAKRLYDHWFVQFDFPNADGKPYKASGGKMVWNETLKREITEGWEVKKLGELFTTNRGVSYSTKTITGEIGIPMINLAFFSPDGSYKIDGIKLYTGDYTQEKVLKPFDLVMCNTQQTAIDFSKDIIGKALLVPDIFEGDITSSHHVNTLKVHNEKLKFYLYRLFNTDYFHAYISHFASGTNIMGLDFAGVENYAAVIPGDEILSNFADFTLNIEKKKSEIIRENTKLISLRDRLLPLLMNGQVIIK